MTAADNGQHALEGHDSNGALATQPSAALQQVAGMPPPEQVQQLLGAAGQGTLPIWLKPDMFLTAGFEPEACVADLRRYVSAAHREQIAHIPAACPHHGHGCKVASTPTTAARRRAGAPQHAAVGASVIPGHAQVKGARDAAGEHAAVQPTPVRRTGLVEDCSQPASASTHARTQRETGKLRGTCCWPWRTRRDVWWAAAQRGGGAAGGVCTCACFQMVEVINEDYQDYVSLSAKLVNVDGAVLRMRKPLLELKVREVAVGGWLGDWWGGRRRSGTHATGVCRGGADGSPQPPSERCTSSVACHAPFRTSWGWGPRRCGPSCRRWLRASSGARRWPSRATCSSCCRSSRTWPPRCASAAPAGRGGRGGRGRRCRSSWAQGCWRSQQQLGRAL